MCDCIAHLRALEALFNGCRKECDQKCVIDNYEVEIIQSPEVEMPYFDSCFCPSGRATEICGPNSRPGTYNDSSSNAAWGAGGVGFGSGMESDRSHFSCNPGRMDSVQH
eukprot:gnl/TRDRNA2_/TRDRNA2_191102_c0_seq1.p1 gnl/TRDRNA2_/TRDRNA2_191102_c0~~gnl/TRDRNA2_/TRDRNA2_191102_c0_seq1.p1  ORF type:complete len:109 (-),score=10.48 gnl/TRDRNA2_/TRDRNA2_191102_c0_seq1:85-411(-)